MEGVHEASVGDYVEARESLVDRNVECMVTYHASDVEARESLVDRNETSDVVDPETGGRGSREPCGSKYVRWRSGHP